MEHDKNVYVNCEKQFLCPGNGTDTASGRGQAAVCEVVQNMPNIRRGRFGKEEAEQSRRNKAGLRG